jgi:hypothetical protein
VQEHVRERLQRHPLAVDLDDVARAHEGVQLAGLPVHADAAGPDQLIRAPP